MNEGKKFIPSRRSSGRDPNRRLGAKVFSYFTPDEKRLIEKAAEIKRRSVSSYVAEAAIERAASDMEQFVRKVRP